MKRHLLSQDGVQLACFEQGSGLPLVLIHGFPFDHLMWQTQIDTLSSVCRVVAPDLRGFGESTLTEADVRDGVEMHRYAADILACLDELKVDRPAILCGFSMGGYVLWQLALKNSERIAGLVLCDTRADADSDESRQARLAMAEQVLASGVEPVAKAMPLKLLGNETQQRRPELVDQLQGMIRRAQPEAIAAAQRGMARRADVRDCLVKLEQPALVVVGSEDAISPPQEMQAIAEQLPNAQFVEVAHAGHMAPLENPTEVCEAVQTFVKKF